MMTAKALATAVLLLIPLLCSCGLQATEPEFSERGFSVDALAGHLWLANTSSAPVHYVALEAETATRVDLYFDPESWPSVGAGEVRKIPYAELMGYGPDARQAVVHWWTQGRYGETVVIDLFPGSHAAVVR